MDSQDAAGNESAAEEGGGTATIVVEPKTKGERKKREVPRYHVILWDSDQHTYEYVEKMLRELFGHTKEQCHKMAEEVDAKGKVIVLTTTKEHAELKRDQITAYGKDERMKNCKGSMHATLEAAS
jgi:ATP-dependent Clp protease adaptor protein ClpS